MSKKQKNKGGMVYSTNPDYNFDFEDEASVETLPNKQQNLRVSLDKKQRKGKMVTLVSNFVGNCEDLKALGKIIKTQCGVGGSVKNNEILIQGDFRDKIVRLLLDLDYKVKKIG